MTKQPEALRLADFFECFKTSGHIWHDGQPLHLATAAELRRLHEVSTAQESLVEELFSRITALETANAELLEALKELVAQTDANFFALNHDHVALQNARAAIAKHGGAA